MTDKSERTTRSQLPLAKERCDYWVDHPQVGEDVVVALALQASLACDYEEVLALKERELAEANAKLARYDAVQEGMPEEPKRWDDRLDRSWPISVVPAIDYDAYRTWSTKQITVKDKKIADLKAKLEQVTAERNAKYGVVAKAVYETVQDHAATWEDASDELMWGSFDVNGPDHQKVSDSHLAECCARFPQWEDDLRDFAKRWNEEPSLTDEELAAIEVDVSEEQIQRGTREMMRLMRFFKKLRDVEKERDGLKAKLSAPLPEVGELVKELVSAQATFTRTQVDGPTLIYILALLVKAADALEAQARKVRELENEITQWLGREQNSALRIMHEHAKQSKARVERLEKALHRVAEEPSIFSNREAIIKELKDWAREALRESEKGGRT